MYVDGYNLYYSRLRNTAFKWLDLVALFDAILARRDQNEKVSRLHLFTAPALANFATHGQDSVIAQSAYHRALQATHPERCEIIYGRHSYDRSGALLPTFVAGQAFDRTIRSRVWKLEEKKTDVNLALRMYRDACKGLYDRVILMSNDSDAEPVLQAIRQDFPDILIGLVIPIWPPTPDTATPRRVSGSLSGRADWVIPNITDDQLRQAQLPDQIPTRKKPIRKPAHW